MREELREKLEGLCRSWHEAGRGDFERRCPNMPKCYDDQLGKSVIEKKKYYYLDEGTSGVFMVEKETGDIYRIKAYGKIHRQKFVGNVTGVTGEDLHRLRWW